MNTPRKIEAGHYELDHRGTTWTIRAVYFLGATHWMARRPSDEPGSYTFDRACLADAVRSIKLFRS